jgi:hypothetical protein
MASIGWGHGGPAESDTGILQALLAFVSQGGHLFGARRWAENPLTLTHVRWHGPTNMTFDAVRDPLHDISLGDEERDVWIQLALTFPPVPPTQPGEEPPWMPLRVETEKAAQWAQSVRQARERARPPVYSGPMHASRPRTPAVQPSVDPGRTAETTKMPRADEPRSQAQTPYGLPSRPVPPSPLPPQSRPYSQSEYGYGSMPRSEPSQWTGSWQQAAADQPEVTVLPCIEVELPILLEGQMGAAYRADFARDIAVHFARAVRTLPQVREMRGWMRGDRLVLAARAVVASGNRGPSDIENDGMARLLQEAVLPETLPYVYLGFADPAEWIHGAPLPE